MKKVQASPKWAPKSFVSFSIKAYWKFFWVSVWLLARNHQNSVPSLKKLAIRIERLLKLSGFSFSVQYLKEVYRLTTKTLAGEQVEPDLMVRVAMRRGLPLIIPGDLRLLMEAKDPVIIKLVLTIVSIFRVIPAYPKLKLETITAPFKGLMTSTPELSLVFKDLENLVGRNS
jgi:hypothetical protein